MKNLRITASIFLVSVLCMAGAVQRGWCLSVSPPRVEISAAPGKTAHGVLTVANPHNDVATVSMRVEERGGLSAVECFEFSPREFDIKRFEVKEIGYTVTVPTTAKGELSVMVFIEAKSKEGSTGAIGVATSIGVPIYLAVKGTETFAAAIETLTAKDNTPLLLEIAIRNKGNVHIRPQGDIAISTLKGERLLRLEVNRFDYPVLPESSRTLEIRSERGLGKGEYKADIHLKYGNNRELTKRMNLKID
ncbi:MAG: hypothetical protein WCG78_00600 [Candidatus Omnitrophota bacterium]